MEPMSAPRASSFKNLELKCYPNKDKVVIGDYYHMTTMNENVNWMKLTHLLWEKISKP